MPPVPVAPWVAPPANGAAEPTSFSALLLSRHQSSRAALGHGLGVRGAQPLHLVGSAGEALLCARTWGPCELGVLDSDLPGEDVLVLLGELARRGWSRLLVVLDPDEATTATEAMHRGASGVLVGNPPKEPGRAAPTDGQVQAATGVLSASGEQRDLSVREVQVLQLVADGTANKAVATTLGISALTVKSHLSRISRKLGTGDRAQLVALALRAGAVS